MDKLIKAALESISMENFYITKADHKGECVVYNYISAPFGYADNRKQGNKYTILLNVYSVSKVEETKAKVIKAMNDFGIRGGEAGKTLLEENGIFNTPIQFYGYKKEGI